MDLKKETTDSLEDLKHRINQELRERSKQATKKVYRVMTNGTRDLAVCCKNFDDAKAELLDEIGNVETFDCTVEIAAIDIPETDYGLRPDRWYGPQ